MPQGNGSPPVWRWPPAFSGRKSITRHRQRGSGGREATGTVGIMQQRGDGGNETRGDGGVEDGEGALQVGAGRKAARGRGRRRNGSLFNFPFH